MKVEIAWKKAHKAIKSAPDNKNKRLRKQAHCPKRDEIHGTRGRYRENPKNIGLLQALIPAAGQNGDKAI